MELRELGRSGLKVSTICLGGNVFGWTVDEKRSFELLDAFVTAGFNFIDTADVYSTWVPTHQGGESETIVGNWLKSRRNRSQVIIATKLGLEMRGKMGLAPARVRWAIDKSLQRLQTDYVDLYQSHQPDPATPIEETLGAYAELMKVGKVLAIGASNYSASQLSEALETSTRCGLPRYESLQPEYNLYAHAKYEQELEPVCLKYGLGVIPYYSLAAGFLTGKYRSEKDFSISARGSGMAKYLNARGTRILAVLDSVAAELRATPAQIALAWLIARPSITAPIASATTPAQLQELVAGAQLKLSVSTLDRLNHAST